MLIGSFPLRVRLAQFSRPSSSRFSSRCCCCLHPPPLKKKSSVGLFVLSASPSGLHGAFRGAIPDPDWSASQLEGSLRVTGNSNRKIQQRDETKRSPRSEPGGGGHVFLVCFVTVTDVSPSVGLKAAETPLLPPLSREEKRKRDSKHWDCGY